MARLSHLVVANTWRYAAGWAPLPRTLTALANVIEERGVDGTARLTFEVPVTDPGATQLVAGRVVTAVLTDGTWTEWELTDETVDADDTGRASFTALGYARALARAPLVREVTADGRIRHAFERVGFTLTEHLAASVLPALADGGLTWIVTGTLEPTGVRTISYANQHPFDALKAVVDAFGAEFWFERDDAGQQVKLHVVNRIGAGVTGADLRYQQNAAFVRTRTALTQATRVYPLGAEGTTMGPNRWSITAKTATGGAADHLLLEVGGALLLESGGNLLLESGA